MKDYTLESLKRMKQLAGPSLAKENDQFLRKLQKKNKKELDVLVHGLHYDEFEKIDCLKCAHCCKTISPIIYESDIQRMSTALKLKTSEFKDKYIEMDEDGDYVFSQTPCPFLDSENYCLIYNNRPKACREYPHTNRKRFYQMLGKTYLNSSICPAVFNIVEQMKKDLY